MSILPGSEGRRDPERAEAARRQRVRFAQDIGDEYGRAWAHEPRRKPRKFTIGTGVVLVAFAALGAIPLLTRGDGGLVRADCEQVRLNTGPGNVAAGGAYAWQFAGPADAQYVLTVDAPSVTVDGSGRAVVPSGTVLFGPDRLPGCRSAQARTTAPAEAGEHEVSLFRRTGTEWQRVAVSSLSVS